MSMPCFSVDSAEAGDSIDTAFDIHGSSQQTLSPDIIPDRPFHQLLDPSQRNGRPKPVFPALIQCCVPGLQFIRCGFRTAPDPPGKRGIRQKAAADHDGFGTGMPGAKRLHILRGS